MGMGEYKGAAGLFTRAIQTDPRGEYEGAAGPSLPEPFRLTPGGLAAAADHSHAWVGVGGYGGVWVGMGGYGGVWGVMGGYGVVRGEYEGAVGLFTRAIQVCGDICQAWLECSLQQQTNRPCSHAYPPSFHSPKFPPFPSPPLPQLPPRFRNSPPASATPPRFPCQFQCSLEQPIGRPCSHEEHQHPHSIALLLIPPMFLPVSSPASLVSSSVLFSNRSAAHAAMKNFQQALHDGRKALQLQPRWAKAYSRIAVAHYGMKQYVEAAAAYEKGLKCDPLSTMCRQGLQQVSSLSEVRQVRGAGEVAAGG
ncbi:unnamed protein product [Closterium sp. NIES-64]|nr:unnamed protein product [Closterium sp. NIES-64]